MKDTFDVELKLGDYVVHAAGSQYVRMSIGQVVGFTPRGVKVQETQGRYRLCLRTWCAPDRLVRIPNPYLEAE